MPQFSIDPASKIIIAAVMNKTKQLVYTLFGLFLHHL